MLELNEPTELELIINDMLSEMGKEIMFTRFRVFKKTEKGYSLTLNLNDNSTRFRNNVIVWLNLKQSKIYIAGVNDREEPELSDLFSDYMSVRFDHKEWFKSLYLADDFEDEDFPVMNNKKHVDEWSKALGLIERKHSSFALSAIETTGLAKGDTDSFLFIDNYKSQSAEIQEFNNTQLNSLLSKLIAKECYFAVEVTKHKAIIAIMERPNFVSDDIISKKYLGIALELIFEAEE